ncbi:YSIRK signal domain/LPXTG anchor domain surface protein [Streptococcus suis]|uniref:YSIRK signal domain/LPXTG anchor domain surface protein n=1 Tax=Streptococcus suis TaxID=1307 RepID=UPI0005CE00EE|nr:YSIRK signal domain/LPXTG anchor domain surface protein [Streptococcus suis]MBM6422216.1 YSIRK signal domain/LPXTG anchor domain surface protein [Streptococcus suis]UYX29720.1 YSIRK signal domain/LPXTG anchor domain surface protein [Streptococcus suis]CYY74550.1 surface-anchored protein [Streptococcus suis]CYY82248.1 surface-anchored protein [Streptococcus suis]HEM3583117.1 YSIRK signal domain/LPXTG anchor domain surface protein [Streptococcus suis]
METANKKFRYSIRKFKVGVGSVLIATCLLGAGVSTPTAFATTETSTATQVEAMAKVEEVQKLVKELEKELGELDKVPSYGDAQDYSYQKALWEEFLRIGKDNMDYASKMKADDKFFHKVKGDLNDFKYQIKVENYIRQVAELRKKYPGDNTIEEEYNAHLKQDEGKSIASQEGATLRDYVDREASEAMGRIKQRVAELEKSKQPQPSPADEPAPAPKEEETPAPKEEDTPAPDAAPAPAPTPEVDPAPTPIPDTPKAEEEAPTPVPDTPAPKEDEVPAPIPDAPTPKVEEETQEPKTEEKAPETKEETPTPVPDTPAPKEDEVPAPTPMPETPMDKPKTDKVESDKQMPEAKQPEMEQPKAEDMPKEEMPKSEQPKAEDSAPKTAVPEVAPKTAEKPKLDFTTKERKVEEALPIKEEIRYDASLPLGKSYLLQEGKAGKKVSVYQDVIVDGKVVATNLLSETVVEGQNRILVKGSLEMKKEEVKTTPSVQSNPTLSHKGAPSANKATLPATGEQRNNLALVGLGLAGISLAVVATAINKKSKDQI